MALPAGPGLGVELDDAAVERYRGGMSRLDPTGCWLGCPSSPTRRPLAERQHGLVAGRECSAARGNSWPVRCRERRARRASGWPHCWPMMWPRWCSSRRRAAWRGAGATQPPRRCHRACEQLGVAAGQRASSTMGRTPNSRRRSEPAGDGDPTRSCIDGPDGSSTVRHRRSDHLFDEVDLDAPAAILFTSGTTARAQGRSALPRQPRRQCPCLVGGAATDGR